jgi:hypothetical protein
VPYARSLQVFHPIDTCFNARGTDRQGDRTTGRKVIISLSLSLLHSLSLTFSLSLSLSLALSLSLFLSFSLRGGGKHRSFLILCLGGDLNGGHLAVEVLSHAHCLQHAAQRCSAMRTPQPRNQPPPRASHHRAQESTGDIHKHAHGDGHRHVRASPACMANRALTRTMPCVSKRRARARSVSLSVSLSLSLCLCVSLCVSEA